jgi:hypothetical protein
VSWSGRRASFDDRLESRVDPNLEATATHCPRETPRDVEALQGKDAPVRRIDKEKPAIGATVGHWEHASPIAFDEVVDRKPALRPLAHPCALIHRSSQWMS